LQLYIHTVYGMTYLPTNTLHIDRLCHALSWGYIVTSQRETIPLSTIATLIRYRFEIAVRGESIQPLLIEGLPSTTGGSEVIEESLLVQQLAAAGLPMTIVRGIERSSCNDLHHVRGTENKTLCKLAYHLPALHPKRLHQVTPFFALPESDQCPRCSNMMNPNYLPVWRFRAMGQLKKQEKPRGRLPK